MSDLTEMTRHHLMTQGANAFVKGKPRDPSSPMIYAIKDRLDCYQEGWDRAQQKWLNAAKYVRFMRWVKRQPIRTDFLELEQRAWFKWMT